MTAARHGRIVILSRVTRTYASAVRNEKWPCLNVSGTLQRLSAGTSLSPRSWSRAMHFQGCNRGVQEHDIASYVS